MVIPPNCGTDTSLGKGATPESGISMDEEAAVHRYTEIAGAYWQLTGLLRPGR